MSRPDVHYDLLVTAVSERADLFAQAIGSLLARVDLPPDRLIVHEDERYDGKGRPLVPSGAIHDWLDRHVRGCKVEHLLCTPARGLGPAMCAVFEQATAPIVLYTQDDYGAVRDLPVERALELMIARDLHHIRFNQRKTLPTKHGDKGRNPDAWKKVEVGIEGQVLCVSDHWYTQTSLWRVAPALEGMRAVLGQQSTADANQFVTGFNRWMNERHGDGRPWNDQAMRHERLRTYIFGPIGEPAYVVHLDTDRARTTGPVLR